MKSNIHLKKIKKIIITKTKASFKSKVVFSIGLISSKDLIKSFEPLDFKHETVQIKTAVEIFGEKFNI